MPTLRTRIYTYTDQSSWKSGVCTLPLSSFEVSGDKSPISELVSISVKYYRRHATSSSVGHTAKLEFASDADALVSSKVTKRGDGSTFSITNSFSIMPAANAFTESNVTLKTIPDTKTSSVQWIASATYPIVITVTYYGSDFNPVFKSANVFRTTTGGENVGISAQLAVNSAGTGGSGKLSLYEVSAQSKEIIGSAVYTKSDVTFTSLSISVSQSPISNYTLDRAKTQLYKFRFAYTAKVNGIEVTETVDSPIYCVPNVYVNVHLAGVSTGGVRFGGYSNSTEGTPLFECKYPAVFENGYRDANDTSQLLSYDGSSTFTKYETRNPYPVLRTVGRIATLQGLMTTTQAITGGTTQHVICTIPEGYAPDHMTTVLQQGTGTAVWLLRIYPDGYTVVENNVTVDRSRQVTFARYREGNSYATVSAGDWLPFYATWIIK